MSEPKENQIKVSRVENGVVWLQFVHKGKPIYEVPLAQALRDFLEPEHKIDVARGDGYNTEQAFKKLALTKALDSELKRA